MKSQSSKFITVSFPNELADNLKKMSAQTGKPLPWIVRQACMLYLNANGINTADIPNSTGKGTRSDLKTLSASEARERLQHLLSIRKLKH